MFQTLQKWFEKKKAGEEAKEEVEKTLQKKELNQKKNGEYPAKRRRMPL